VVGELDEVRLFEHAVEFAGKIWRVLGANAERNDRGGVAKDGVAYVGFTYAQVMRL
jgi:hypothetical protein